MTEKEFQNLFDSIRCSESFTAHMEELLAVPPASGFAETASGVSVAQPRRHWVRWAGLAACLLLIVGGAAVLQQREQVPIEYPVATDRETVRTEQSAGGSETQTETKQSTETADSSETQSITEAFIVTQTISDTSMTEAESVTETTGSQTEAEESAMSEPTMPPETQPGTTTTALTTAVPETTTTANTTLPDLRYDRADFPMQGLETTDAEALLVIGYHYFQAAIDLDAYVVTCPYRTDYMNTEGRSFEEDGKLWFPVTDGAVTSAADVQEDFYDVYASDKDSSHLADFYRDKADGLYFAGGTGISNPEYEGYYLTLDTVTDTQITYTCHIRNNGQIGTQSFRLVKEADGWKVGYITNPLLLKILVLPAPDDEI